MGIADIGAAQSLLLLLLLGLSKGGKACFIAAAYFLGAAGAAAEGFALGDAAVLAAGDAVLAVGEGFSCRRTWGMNGQRDVIQEDEVLCKTFWNLARYLA